MKKVLAFLVVTLLVAAASVCVVFAAPSAEAQGIVSGVTAVDADKNNADVNLEKIDGKVNKNFYETLKGLKDETKDKTLKVVGHYEAEIEGDVEYPLTITLDVLGISKSSKVYVLLQKGNDVVAVTPDVKNGKVTFEAEEEFDKIAIVTDGKTATKVEKENDVLSPQTSDVTPFVVVAVVLTAVAALFVSKKVMA